MSFPPETEGCPHPLFPRKRAACGPGGFSLVELLAVLALLGVLAVFAIPAAQSLAGARGVSRAAYDVAGLLELARSEAVSRQTYVWVGFETNQAPEGLELRMAAVASRDGSGTNTMEANLLPLTKVIKVRQTALSRWSDLKSPTRDLAPQGTPTDVSTHTGGIPFTVGSTAFENGRTVTFTPRGEIVLKGAVGPYDGYTTLAAVSLRQARGAEVLPDADDAAVLIDGPTGAVSTLRLP